MMQADVLAVLSQVFGVPVDSIPPDASPDSIRAWDSLGHLELIAALESRFDRRFQLREIQSMDNLAAIEAILTAHTS